MHLENRIKDVRQVTHSVKTGIKLIGFLLLLGLNFQGMGQHRSHGEPLRKGRISLKLTVRDSHNRNAVEYATLLLKKGKNRQVSGITDEKGSHTFLSIPKGDYELTVTSLGYKSRTIDLHARRDTTLTILLLSNDIAMQDVVVTAYESRGATSASRIDRKAMEHLQPSSFTDLVELLPGNVSKDPSMGSANLIKLREAGGTGPSDYDVTSFGTSFVIDGVPLNNDANMQYISNSWETGRNTTGKGIDMRSISTDDIAKVEIVRGIPSVEYGDLTSGLVNIERKKGGNDLEARFKADMQSQLFYVGKGIELTDKQFTLNTGIDYLDSKIDPRNNRENFKRVTGSIRTEKRWTNDHWRWTFNSNLNYRGTFENDKNDPDLTPSGAIDSYESSNNALSLAGTLSLNNRKKGFFRSLSLTASASGSWDNIHQEKTVVPSKLSVVPTATQPGVHDAEILPSTYLASLDVNGNPFNAFVKAIATFNYNYRNWFNIIKVGGDWRMNKNYGEGQLYDMRRPISIDITTRPRPFNDIPAEHNLAFFIEEASKLRLGKHRIDITAGLRSASLLNLDNRYVLDGKIYLDPRVNAKWALPRIGERKPLSIELSGGVGWHTKMPDISKLYPDLFYYDLIQLNFFSNENPAVNRMNVHTFIDDLTNYNLKAARNMKWEVRADFSIDDHRLSVTYFREKMTSGFRQGKSYTRYIYNRYSTEGLDPSTMTGPPDLADLTFTPDTILKVQSVHTNGSRILKEGVEFQYSSKRFPIIRTRLTVNGAWFRTTYNNSQPVYKRPSVVIDGRQIRYIGLYNEDDGYIRESFNTNFTFDTDIPRLKLGFSTSIQCMWFTSSQSMWESGVPIAYVNMEGELLPYTDAERNDMILQHLVESHYENNFKKRTIPIDANINIKVTKKICRDKIALALYVNRLVSYHPDYTLFGNTIRRTSNPYFGMEINFRL